MRLYGYYALHSFVNQIRKLLKTWVLIFFLACVLLGGLIGLGAGILSEVGEEQTEETFEIAAEMTAESDEYTVGAGAAGSEPLISTGDDCVCAGVHGTDGIVCFWIK